jgi:hypothetical protein
VAERSEARVCGCLLTGVQGVDPARGMDVSCECCVLSSRGICDGPIIHPEESY